ncbi:hypothetical protein MPH_03503 [Macrophomina phaseolina MS6]|uniref:Uncharacterized protein n=2 Tax=Macrophomina phaseolina TaxID=35725 RepID=K2S2J2_MACPH|nr:hypothetical protein MPH_03503 [Macrophomina phaseolina MS6]KAH7054500.1 hypothetical protein B0J12DRAFT_739016 [Macrophomina phaseolina]
MGNLCGKQSKDDNFAGPGRTLGSAPPPSDNARASIPATKKSPLQGNGRTLGGPGGSGDDDPRSAAAKAAEERAASNKAKTTRNQKLTDRAALAEASYAERRARDADEMANARAWN